MKSLKKTGVLGFRSLSEAMEARLEGYFEMHGGVDMPTGLYDIIIKEIEKSLLNVTMRYAEGHVTGTRMVLNPAAAILCINSRVACGCPQAVS